ncbi:Spy/CpxP family protein refolding chaperone [Acidocella aminolytica]|uniref:LTXXQ motif family protein n=1 Tax=Acidocella aminolytica 101 = DSM 11237 TaxID=1120923 RepID=A0A0D6PFH7_9PROT|nr:Spy/CpxP family protein refolding chaperone [Acidocella aminolytica]GAN80510.1 hypothetical protein Aam_049_012 [Acidocella aminolytica 101 = DSM 11237]GBQ37826.1 hypothetical protein AA11237_1651 [Acidocella aminolytica 101 = DSM 11237]SHF39617.1 LTXXQ motif family protein [Acidocella aminolytica 101 = DSM 11237]
MHGTVSRVGSVALVTLGFAVAAGAALAQTPGMAGNQSGSGYGPGYGMMYGAGAGYGFGPGMIGGAPGFGPGMMQGWGGGRGGWGPGGIQNRLDAVKAELKITAAETAAWNTYEAAITSAHKAFWNGMQPLWQSGGNGAWTPDQRFQRMDQMVGLMRQRYQQEKQAADALVSHLTPYQQGQAQEILPGLAGWGTGRGCGVPWGGPGA